ncbi:MAG: hypothetical protein FWG63_09230 [Defluviitaleaceae bacterium]|nr:hypothetical protein [Defluviitaleaceae bacterium]
MRMYLIRTGLPFFSDNMLLKTSWEIGSKACLYVGVFLIMLGALLSHIIGINGGPITFFILALQGVVWCIVSLVLSRINRAKINKLQHLKEVGNHYKAEISALLPNPTININKPVVFAELIYVNEQGQRCKIKTGSFMWKSYSSSDGLCASVYTDKRNPANYAVEITQSKNIQTDIDIDYTQGRFPQNQNTADRNNTFTPIKVLVCLLALVFVGNATRMTFFESGQWAGFGGLAATGRAGSWAGMSRNVGNQEWSVSANSANGWVRHTFELNAQELANFRVAGTLGTGEMHLYLDQGEIRRRVDIYDNFAESIDMHGFEPGRIRLTLEFSHVHNARVTINWGT